MFWDKTFLAKVCLANLHPPFKGGPPFPPSHPPFFKGGWKYILSNPPFLWVASSTLDQKIVMIMKKIFFLKFSLFFQNVQLIVNSKKVFLMFNIEYLQNFIFRKIKWFKVFQKSNIFLFSDREFYGLLDGLLRRRTRPSVALVYILIIKLLSP